MVMVKQNLVINRDGTDILKCSECGFKKKYIGFIRPKECPRCGASSTYPSIPAKKKLRRRDK